MLNIYRGTTINLSLHIDDNTRLIRQLLGEDIIKSSFSYHTMLDITIGDYIVFDNVKYYINNLPNIKKNSSNSFDYDITFESEYYELLKTQFMDLDGNSDFSLVGNLETFIDLIIANMNRIYSGWARGACDQTNTDYKLLNFSKNNCMQVLQQLCDEFEGEFFFDFEMYFEVEGGGIPYLPAVDAVIPYKPAAEGEHYYDPAEASIAYYSKKDICFTDKAGSDSGLTFLYHQGLRNIQRTTLSEKNIVTRLFAFGASKNLSSDYRDHSTRLKFVSGGLLFLEKNVDKYGTIEHTEIFEDIYPHRDGTISAVNGGDITKFIDTNEPLMFNLNEYLLPGVTAKLHFNSGNLGGYEFEVSAYNHTTKEFTIIAFTDEIGYEMPNATLKPAIGDKYVLVDIKMPQSYIDTAETLLQVKAQTYLDDNCEPRVTYILEPDWRYFKLHTVSLEVGDFITITDTDLGIDVMTRIIELTKSLNNIYKYTLKLTDHLEVQLIQRMYSEQEDLKKKIEIGEGGDVIRSRRNWRTSEELRSMIFDTDGYFDMGKIRPESIETSMLSVGVKSTQFILSGVEIEGNYLADVSKFHASAGSLIHLSFADEITIWTLSENSQDSLVDETAYYIYAQCTKEPGYTGQVIVDSTQRKFDDDPTYYYFLIGVLHSVVDGVRGISLTYGQTIINGKFIRTGKIESTDGLTYFDLDNGLIQGKITFISGTTGYDNISDSPTLPSDVNLVGYWSLNEGKGIIAHDSSGNENHGTLVNMEEADWVKGVSGKCLSFDNTTDEYVTCGNKTVAGAFSMSVWVKPTDLGPTRGIIGNLSHSAPCYGANMYQNNDDIRIAAGDGIGNRPTHAWANVLTAGVLTHLVAVYDGSKFILYVNGEKQAYEWTATVAQNSTTWIIAQWASTYLLHYQFYGLIDEVRIYNRVLTAQEVKALYLDPSGLGVGVNPGATDDTVANTKTKVFRQATAPTSGMVTGDIWIDTDDGDKPRTYNGAIWVLMYTIINGGYIETGSITADKLFATNLSGIFADLGHITAGDITLNTSGFIKTAGKNSYASTVAGFWLGYDGAYKLSLGAATNYLKWDGVNLSIKGTVEITGGSGISNLLDAGDLAILDVVEASKLGTTIISGGYLRTDLIKVRKIYVGGGTNEDIYFEDSGIRLYDTGGQCVNFYKSGLKIFQIGIGSTLAAIGCLDGHLQLFAQTKNFFFYSTGTLQLPTHINAPTGHEGDIAVEDSGTGDANEAFHVYINGRWLTCDDGEGW